MKSAFKSFKWIGVIGLLLLSNACNNKEKEILDGDFVLEVACNEVMGEVSVMPDQDYYRKGQEVMISATAKEGFVFKAWRAGVTELATSAILELKIESDTSVTALFESKENPDEDDLQAYTVDLDWTEGGERVTISPATGPYIEGSIITLEAVAMEGYRFIGWQGVSGQGNPVQLIVDSDLSIKALFEKIPVLNASDLRMKVDGHLNLANGFWDFEVRLTDVSGQIEDVDDAEVIVAGFKLTKDDFFEGLYEVGGLNLLAGEEITVVLKHQLTGERSYKITIPPTFSEDNLDYAFADGVLQLDWEALDCDGYKFMRHFESNSGSITADSWPLLTASTLSVTENEIFTSYVSFQLTPPVYYTVWLCPVNKREPLDGLAADSHITLVGRRGTRLSNKPE